MHLTDKHLIAAYLAHRGGLDSTRIASDIVAICSEIDAALSPIIGQRGVAALFKRSVHVASLSHGWLTPVHAGAATNNDSAGLAVSVGQQTPAEAAAVGGLFLQTFYELLTTLIGPSLTERLLRSVWANFLSGTPERETSP